MVCIEHKSVAPSDSALDFPSTRDFRDVSSVDAHDYTSREDARDHAAADLHSAARPNSVTLAPPAHDNDSAGTARSRVFENHDEVLAHVIRACRAPSRPKLMSPWVVPVLSSQDSFRVLA